MGATGFSVVSQYHNLKVYRREDTFWSTWGSFLCWVPLRLGEAVEHIVEYYNEASSAIYPQLRCYTAVPTHQTSKLLALDEKSTFDCFCFIRAYIASPALYAQIEQKQSKVDFSLKAKSSNVRDFLRLIGTVLATAWLRGCCRSGSLARGRWSGYCGLGNALENNFVFFNTL
jgi:hypothetical protein